MFCFSRYLCIHPKIFLLISQPAYQGGQSLSERIFRHNLSRVWVGLVVLQWQYMCRLSWRQLVQLCSGHLLPPVSDNPGLRNHFLVHPRSCCTVIATPKDPRGNGEVIFGRCESRESKPRVKGASSGSIMLVEAVGCQE